MAKTIEQWLLFKYVGGEFTPLSKPFKSREPGGESTPEISRASAQDDWAGCNPPPERRV